jgi:hypothetical protein
MKRFRVLIVPALILYLLVFPLTIQAQKENTDERFRTERKLDERYFHEWSSMDLDKDILQKIKEIKLKHREKMIDLRSNIEKKELEFERVLMEEDLNVKKLLSINDDILNLRNEMVREMLKQKINIYEVIPDDKKEEAKRIIFHHRLRDKLMGHFIRSYKRYKK